MITRLVPGSRRKVATHHDADLTACDNYRSALAAAGKVTAPTIVILGGGDVMTPTKSGKALAAAIPASCITGR
jgi:pimeloyl-ACP methyl ester carboxylesterase